MRFTVRPTRADGESVVESPAPSKTIEAEPESNQFQFLPASYNQVTPEVPMPRKKNPLFADMQSRF
jgi:hypothetical protein